MCIINHWLDNWECFMDARSASQGLGPSVLSPELRFGSSVGGGGGESHESLRPFPSCPINARMRPINMK